MMVAAGSLCEECGPSMDDGKLYDYNDSVMIPLGSYCFVNECTIRIEELNVLLNVINNTGDWIIATNATHLFTTFVNDSSNTCSSADTDHGTNLYQLDTELYVIRMIAFCAGIIAGVANTITHVMFKELRTVSGILIIFQCASVSIIFLLGTLRTPFYYRHINTPAVVCAIFFDYLNVVCTNIYVVTRATILAHFSYVMYRTYRLLGKCENERSLLYKYITFIVGASTINSIIIIAVDVALNDKAFETGDGQCVYFFDTLDKEGTQLTKSNVVYFVILIIWLLIHVALVIIGLVLYILATKQCCGCTTSTSRDFRVFIVLMTIVELNTIILIMGLSIRISTLIGDSIMITVAASEQVALFVLFASSSKVTCCTTKV